MAGIARVLAGAKTKSALPDGSHHKTVPGSCSSGGRQGLDVCLQRLGGYAKLVLPMVICTTCGAGSCLP